MDQEKIGKFILNLRKENKLTQKEFADKFGVTYQAVSKWENGKNIPDIAIIKSMCEEFDVDINDILDLKMTKKKNKFNYKYFLFIIPILIIFIVVLAFRNMHTNADKDFEFKTIEAACDNFNIYGNMAYNSNKSYISISKIEYCGNEDNTKYEKIECNLYKIDEKREETIRDCGYINEEPQTLDEYLKNVKFNVDNYSAMCSYYADNSLQLKIEAKDENGKITTYKIPIKLNDSCK